MSSNLELQEDTSSSPVEDRAKMIENFVKDLVVNRDFKLDDNGDIIMIRQLSVAKCTFPLLRRICVRFKVSGYKNQNKESTLGLLKNLVVQRDSLKNNMYNDDEDSVSTYISGSSQERARDKGTQPLETEPLFLPELINLPCPEPVCHAKQCALRLIKTMTNFARRGMLVIVVIEISGVLRTSEDAPTEGCGNRFP